MVVTAIVAVLVVPLAFFMWQLHQARIEEIKKFQRPFDYLSHWNIEDDRWLHTILIAPFDWETEENPIIDIAYDQGVAAVAA